MKLKITVKGSITSSKHGRCQNENATICPIHKSQQVKGPLQKKKIQTGSKREKSNNVCCKTQTARRNSERQKAERTGNGLPGKCKEY